MSEMRFSKSRKVASMLLASSFIIVATSDVIAQQLTNDMTCAEAKEEFEDRGRLLTRSRRGNVVKIYGGEPIRHADFDEDCSVQYVRTEDRRSCHVSARCSD